MGPRRVAGDDESGLRLLARREPDRGDRIEQAVRMRRLGCESVVDRPGLAAERRRQPADDGVVGARRADAPAAAVEVDEEALRGRRCRADDAHREGAAFGDDRAFEAGARRTVGEPGLAFAQELDPGLGERDLVAARQAGAQLGEPIQHGPHLRLR
jgi:hypothetical protein